ncbi:MAG: carboxy terminal-processing peptidase [Gammaproteobacteria bacterium]|nr:carboxy terminal-processing peptidase [Gammaproteobacteria bacterium]MBU6508605.1 carboxy terminal-processing peptidase [Gammaproteobacteria bacterium]MDE1983092.1 carboxy terminal-processing peptidase [Gammaproteobacteria bacterium]MDE2107581.1 carboxy terminal-processing peptidase [Gammaproteobacteria bacterium]
MREKSLAGLICIGLMLLAAAANAASVTVPAAASLAPLPALSPQPREALVDQAIAGILERYHYNKAPLDKALSEQIFFHYLQNLDPNRSYFLQSDIDSFTPYSDSLGDAIRNGNLHPAFAIYNVYQQRVQQRIQYALGLLSKEPDFDVKESYAFDRSKAPWATSVSQLNDLWRQRVKNDALGLLLAGKSWKQTVEILRKRYQNIEYRARQIAPADVFDLFMNSYTLSLDPHTNYFSPDQSQEFQIQMSLKLQGIGAALISEGEYTRVDRVIPGGPAARSKQLHPDDRITGVAQGDQGGMVDVVGWRLDDVVQLIRGPKGSVVRLQILPAGAPPGSPEKVLRLVRDTVKLEAQAAHKNVISVTRAKHSYKIGVITIPAFYSDFAGRMEGEANYTSTTRDVRKLLLELEAEHVDGVVIDLRNNGGGALDEATKLTGLFIPHGPVVQIRHRDGRVDVLDDDDSGIVYRGPLAVLVNRFTASASEIFAAAIQDYHRGLIIGSDTYGKGSVQTLFDLNRIVPGNQDAGQLKLTVDKFYRVNGASTQRKGVTPDITLPSNIDPQEFGEETQDDALPWDQIAAVDYSPLHLGIAAMLPKLDKLHSERTAHSPAWALYLDGLRLLAQERAEKSVPLLLTARAAQRSDRDRERLALANGWRKLKGLPPAANLEAAYKLAESGADKAHDTTEQDTGADDAAALVPDVLLQETARIAADMAALGVGNLPPAPASP